MNVRAAAQRRARTRPPLRRRPPSLLTYALAGVHLRVRFLPDNRAFLSSMGNACVSIAGMRAAMLAAQERERELIRERLERAW